LLDGATLETADSIRVIDELHVGDSVFKTDTEILIGWKNHFTNLSKESDRMDFDHSYLV
jgi:hypothetical protein